MSSPDERSLRPVLTGYSQNFLDLMRWRVREVLLVSSQYDSFLFDEDGQLYGLIQDEYLGLGLSLSNSPEIVKVTRTSEALQLLREGRHFDRFLVSVFGSLGVRNDIDLEVLVNRAVAIRVKKVRRRKREFVNVVEIGPPEREEETGIGG